ncbi:hypothetical protein O181_057968 [Austropuccinia psidii MF-1]|uniref:Uncharacterized protein n=1 Tax=Austropuccinia psidii MF-1 TaxID=1389203 RepID=A0A9Q3EC82_9BASI|nr:hypothetical protein [Austropuccinia psidii MF-1]
MLKDGDLIFISTSNFNNIEGSKRLKYFFSGPFIIKFLHGKNEVHVELTGELENKYLTFPVSLVKNYTSSHNELFPLRNEPPLEVPPIDHSEEKKVLQNMKICGFQKGKYLIHKGFLEDSEMGKDPFLNEKSELYALNT